MKGKRLLPPAYLFTSIVVMAMLHYIAPVVKLIPYPYNLVGGVPLALGIVLNLTADRAFKRYGTTVKPFEESTALVRDGAFRISRHPMYLGMVLILLGIAMLMGSATPFLVVAAFGISMDRVFVRAEERMLEGKFDAAWRDYKSQVRRWI